MGQIDLGLRNATSPDGIVSFEFCAYNASCMDTLTAWGAEGQRYAMFSLGLDFLFMLLYPGFIAVCLLLTAPHLSPRLKQVTLFAASLTVAMWLADVIETYSLTQIVLRQSDELFGPLAAAFATAKFSILGITVLWLLVAGICAVLGTRLKN
jgi:hypothetical protein